MVSIETFLLNQMEYISYRPYEIKDRNRSGTGFFTEKATIIKNTLQKLNNTTSIKDPGLLFAFEQLIKLLISLGNG